MRAEIVMQNQVMQNTTDLNKSNNAEVISVIVSDPKTLTIQDSNSIITIESNPVANINTMPVNNMPVTNPVNTIPTAVNNPVNSVLNNSSTSTLEDDQMNSAIKSLQSLQLKSITLPSSSGIICAECGEKSKEIIPFCGQCVSNLTALNETNKINMETAQKCLTYLTKQVQNLLSKETLSEVQKPNQTINSSLLVKDQNAEFSSNKFFFSRVLGFFFFLLLALMINFLISKNAANRYFLNSFLIFMMFFTLESLVLLAFPIKFLIQHFASILLYGMFASIIFAILLFSKQLEKKSFFLSELYMSMKQNKFGKFFNVISIIFLFTSILYSIFQYPVEILRSLTAIFIVFLVICFFNKKKDGKKIDIVETQNKEISTDLNAKPIDLNVKNVELNDKSEKEKNTQINKLEVIEFQVQEQNQKIEQNSEKTLEVKDNKTEIIPDNKNNKYPDLTNNLEKNKITQTDLNLQIQENQLKENQSKENQSKENNQ